MSKPCANPRRRARASETGPEEAGFACAISRLNSVLKMYAASGHVIRRSRIAYNRSQPADFLIGFALTPTPADGGVFARQHPVDHFAGKAAVVRRVGQLRQLRSADVPRYIGIFGEL